MVVIRENGDEKEMRYFKRKGIKFWLFVLLCKLKHDDFGVLEL